MKNLNVKKPMDMSFVYDDGNVTYVKWLNWLCYQKLARPAPVQKFEYCMLNRPLDTSRFLYSINV